MAKGKRSLGGIKALRPIQTGSLILVAVFTFQGCATVGVPFRFRGPESVRVGKTTESDIVALYGKPFRIGFENGLRKWTYGYYHYKLFGDSETKDLDVTFDKNGVVTDYTYSSSNPDEVNQGLQSGS